MFCLKVILLVVILFGVDRMVGAIFVKMKNMGLNRNPENMWLKTAHTIEKVNADIVIIGSSKASHHYVPQMISDSLDMTAYNCGQDGCFFLYQNCIINMLLDRYKPKMIIWDIQPGSFLGNGAANEYQNFRYLSPYYPDNEWVESYINSESPKMHYRMMSKMFAYNSKVLNYLFPLVARGSETTNGYIPLPSKGYALPSMLIHTESKLECDINEEYLILLDRTLKRCKEKGVQFHMFISPEFSQKPKSTMTVEKEIARVTEENEMGLMNAHSERLFMHDASLFKDVGHLNDKGARLYTKMIIKRLKTTAHGNGRVLE